MIVFVSCSIRRVRREAQSGARLEDRGRSAAGREAPETKDRYPHLLAVPTRWIDNDVYGHVNNVVYYSYFDTVVNGHLIEAGLLDIATSPAIGLVVETGCTYYESVE